MWRCPKAHESAWMVISDGPRKWSSLAAMLLGDAGTTDESPGGDGACTVACSGKCGQVQACGGILSWGGCPSGQTCGGPNVCGSRACTPDCNGKACGHSDGGGGICASGTCGSGQCTAGVCACKTISDCGGGTSCTGGRCIAAKVILFGGFAGSNDLADTWEWNGSSWTKLSPRQSSVGTQPALRSARGPCSVHYGRSANGEFV